ncbi:MAG: VanZ family protein [Atopobiaceae bacterium]|jgi:glycopeptide antibiotics resistance protein/uncharacterized RDD family membrane protein YckC|nr:VanZ family protein [Atopobiaceae bacterium]MCI2173525.1 VanZ family protein [Atopobiaceae bacterium]MCI2207520.1 VanZ family protein [Atopobiaceae bacterium]
MAPYLSVIKSGFLTFPLVALVMLIPYMVYEYRKYGTIPGWKTFLVFSLILYLICAYYLVILPLPADHDAVVSSCLTPQLHPFLFLRDIASATKGLSGLSGLLVAIRKPAVYQVLFNIALTMPVGAYAHYLFHRRWWQALLMGFCLSLFFEVTQLTGIFGIYAHPYRLFDVDDLIVNTTGALVGFWLSIPLCHLLPDIRDVNARALERGRSYPSFTRRLLAFAFDSLLAALVCIPLAVVSPVSNSATQGIEACLIIVVATGVVFMVVPTITKGRTVGQALVRLRIVRPDGSRPAWYCYVARYGLLIWVLLMAPGWVVALFPAHPVEGISVEAVLAVVLAGEAVWMVTVAVRAVSSRLGRHPFIMLNAVMSGTRVMACSQVEAMAAELAAIRDMQARSSASVDVDVVSSQSAPSEDGTSR